MRIRVSHKRTVPTYVKSYSVKRDSSGHYLRTDYKIQPLMQTYRDYSYRNFNLFGIVFIILFVFAFVSSVMGLDSNVSFSTLLQALSNAKTIDIASIMSAFNDLRITDDWSVFNWLKTFINQFLMPLISVLTYFALSIAQLFVFLFWVVRFLFTGVY